MSLHLKTKSINLIILLISEVIIIKNIVKRVLYISPLPPPRGGIATWTKKILDYGLPNQYKPYLVNTGIKGRRKVFERVKFNFSELFRTILIIFSLFTKLIAYHPKIVHLNSSISYFGVFRDYFCTILVKLFKIPIVISYHGDLTNFSKIKYRGLPYKQLIKLIKMADINIVLNKQSYNFIAELNKSGKNNIYKIDNFIDDNIFKNKVEKISKEDSTIKVIYVGGITKTKGCYDIIKIARKLQDVNFIMIGDILKDMEEYILNSPKNMFWSGVLNHDEVINKMYSSNILLFPSHSEGFPNVVLEAMAMGLPVISTYVGAIPEMIDNNKGGFLFEIGDITGFINAINKLKIDYNLRKSMGEHNKRKCKNHYSFSKVSMKLTEIYDSVIKDK